MPRPDHNNFVALFLTLVFPLAFWAMSDRQSSGSTEAETENPFIAAEDQYAQALDLWDYLAAHEHRWPQALDDFRKNIKNQRKYPSLALYFQQVADLTRKAFLLTAPQRQNPELSLNNRCFEYVQDVMDELEGDVDFSITALALAAVARNKGAVKVAHEYLGLSLHGKKQRDPFSLSQARLFHAKAMMAWQSTLFSAARFDFERAIKALEGQIEGLADSRQEQGRFRARYPQIYKDTIAFHLEKDELDEAFAVLELFRGRSLLQTLAEKALPLKLSPQLSDEKHAWAQEYDLLQRRIIDLEPNSRTLDALTAKRLQLHEKRGQWIEEVRRRHPKSAALHYPRSLDRWESQEALDPGTVMLSFNVGKRTTDLFVLSKQGGLSVFTLSVGEQDLRTTVERFRELIAGARPGRPEVQKDFQDLAEILYRKLIEPAAEVLLDSKRLLIIPDGPLHYLPWSCLIRRAGRPAGAASTREGRGQYLIEWKPIHVALSATVYSELQSRSRLAVPQINAEAEGPEVVAFGDARYSPSIESGSPQTRSHRGLYNDWPSLPSSRTEVKGIQAAYPQRQVQVHLGFAATEEMAKKVDPRADILHFAAHGYLDDELPWDSAIVLTPPSRPGPGIDNGLFQAWEIAQLNIQSKLVVLSACGSALGEEQAGEGLIGLTRAFQIAGARSVAASLWEVQDSATGELMTHFHRGLEGGLGIDEALRGAQIELIRNPATVMERDETIPQDLFSAPYFWAAFQVYGSRESPFAQRAPDRDLSASDRPRSRAVRSGQIGKTLFVSRFDGADDVVFLNESQYYSSPGLPIQASSNGRFPGAWKAGRDLYAEHRGTDPWLITENGRIRFQGGRGPASDKLYLTHQLPGIAETWFLEVRFVAAQGHLNQRPHQFSITGSTRRGRNPRGFSFQIGLIELALNDSSKPFFGLHAGEPFIARIWNLHERAIAEIYSDADGSAGKLLGAMEAPSSGALESITLVAGNFTGGVFAVDHIVLKELDADSASRTDL